MKPVLVSVCGDPGGAHALAPVLKVIEAEGRLHVTSYAYNEAVEILKRQGVPGTPLPGTLDSAGARRRFEEAGPRLLLAGTSHNGRNFERLFIASARALGIPSLAVLDFWSNYAARFSDERGALGALPDRVAVMDERARSEMVAAGIPPEAILVTGQPAHDSLRESRESYSPARRSELRRSLGSGDGDLLVLFASQPLERLYSEPSAPGFLGYHEHLVIPELLRALEEIGSETSRSLHVLIRPHPRETKEDFRRYASRKIRLSVSAEGDGREIAMAADLVAGMNSAYLLEACYLGAVVLSLQPGLRGTDPLPTNAWGASRGVYSREEISPALRQLLLDPEARRAARERCDRLHVEGKASRKIADQIYAMISGTPAPPPARKGATA